MKCNRCGGENNNGEQYCKYCRNQLVEINNGYTYNKPAPVDNSGLNKIINPTFPIRKFLTLVVCIILIVILYYVLNDSKENGPIVGKWLCSSNFNFDKEEASTIINFTKDGKFTFAKNGDEDNNYYKGTYTSKKLDKTNAAGTAEYYSAKITLKESKLEGEKNTEDLPRDIEYEIAVPKTNSGDNQAVMANTSDSALLYCYKK